MLNYEYPPLGGGAGNQMYYILKEFYNKKEINIDYITSSITKFYIENTSPNIKIHYLNINKKGSLHAQSFKDLILYSIKAYFYSKKLIKKQKYDFIHAIIGIPCGYIAYKLPLPYLISLVGSDVPFHTPKYRFLDQYVFKNLSKKIWKKAKFVVANSQGLKEEALQTSENQPFEVIYNGVNFNEFKPSLQKVQNSEIRLVSVGRLAIHKGYHFLLHAIAGLNNVHLTLMGDGSEINQLKELANKLKIKADFLGQVSQQKIISVLQQSDVFILPSLTEGMSNALLEAIACGLPVIVTDVGGSAELVKNNGFIVEKGNSIAIREKIIQYTKQPELLEKHAQNSIKIAKEMGWEKVANQYNNLYLKMI